MVTKGRKLLAAILFLGIAFLAVFMTGFVSKADTNQGYELTTIEDKTLYTTPASPKKVNVFIFGHVTCGNTMNTLGFLGEQDWLDDPEIGISFVDLLDSPKADVIEFSKQFSSKFNYCYGKEATRNQMIAKALNNGELGSLPIIVYVDAEGTVRKVTHGMQYGEPIYYNICEILGRDPDMCINVHFDGKILAAEARKELAMINDFRKNDAWYYMENGNITEIGGLSDLTYDYDLEKVAIQRAKEIVVWFDHQRANGNIATTAFPDGYSAMGENLAAGQRDAKAVMEAWKETDEDYYGQGHRRNMLSGNYNAVGMACVEVNGVRFWVQEFGYKDESSINTTSVSYSEAEETCVVELAGSLAKTMNSKYPSGELNLKVDKSVQVPTAPYLLGTFDIPVYLSSTVKAEDAGVAAVSGGKVLGLKHGKTKLIISTEYLPKKTKKTEIPVTVNGYQIKGAKVTLSATTFRYNGKVQKPTVRGVMVNGKKLVSGKDYTITWSKSYPKNAGKYTLTLKGKGKYTGSKTMSFKIVRSANPLKVKAKKAAVSFAKLKKSVQKLSASKVISFTAKGKGTMAYTKVSGNSKIKINKTTGQVTVAKGLKKGTYAVKIKLKAKGNANYQASKVIPLTLKIVVK